MPGGRKDEYEKPSGSPSHSNNQSVTKSSVNLLATFSRLKENLESYTKSPSAETLALRTELRRLLAMMAQDPINFNGLDSILSLLDQLPSNSSIRLKASVQAIKAHVEAYLGFKNELIGRWDAPIPSAQVPEALSSIEEYHRRPADAMTRVQGLEAFSSSLEVEENDLKLKISKFQLQLQGVATKRQQVNEDKEKTEKDLVTLCKEMHDQAGSLDHTISCVRDSITRKAYIELELQVRS